MVSRVGSAISNCTGRWVFYCMTIAWGHDVLAVSDVAYPELREIMSGACYRLRG